jgi:ribosomal protein S18 acetylase RimI-like enzyme
MYSWEMESIDKSLQEDPKVQQLIRDDCYQSIKDTQMIMDQDKTIGMFTACMIDNGEWRYIGEIYLIPEYRGQHIGSTILKNEITNYDRIRLQVAYDNENALRLYKSLGFKIVKENKEAKLYIMEYDKSLPVTEAFFKEAYLKAKERNSLKDSEFGIVTEAFFKEAYLKAKERNSLKDSEFGIPELRKYPLTDETHINMAVKFFGKAPKKYKLSLAKRILRAAHSHDMDTDGWDTINDYIKNHKESDKKEKPIKEYDNILVSNEEFFMESQATRNKVLERLKYDPATQTIDTGVKDAQTGNNIRIKLKISSTKIDPELNKNGGAQFTKIVYDRPSSLYEMLSDPRCGIKVESKLLNQRNNSALAIIYHEIGHLVDWIATKYSNHLSNEDKQTCQQILNFLNKKADYFDRSDTNEHLNRGETFADKFANTKMSSQALNKSNEKTDRKIMNDAYSEYKKFKKNKEYAKARENSLRHDKHELGSQLRSQLISSKMESSNIFVSNEEFFGLTE